MSRQQKQQSQLIQNYMYSIKSKETQKSYLLYIDYFQRYHKNPIERLLDLDQKIIEKILISYIVFMREKVLSHSSIQGRLAAITLFLEINDIIINHKKLRKFMGEQTRTIKDEAYTHDDLLKMFQQATFREKLIISIYSSTGIRKGALVDLKLKHLQKINNLYKLTIYENTKEEYITFCTAECASMIDSYIEQRKQAGEKITEESYLLRNNFDYRISARNPKQVTVFALDKNITFLLDRINFRETNHKTENYQYKRHKKSIFHAFRKYFTNQVVNSKVNPEIREMLLGHKIGLASAYYRPSDDEMLNEYLKAVDNLTINEENRLKRKVEKLEVEKSLMDQLRAEVFSIKQEMTKYKQN